MKAETLIIALNVSQVNLSFMITVHNVSSLPRAHPNLGKAFQYKVESR